MFDEDNPKIGTGEVGWLWDDTWDYVWYYATGVSHPDLSPSDSEWMIPGTYKPETWNHDEGTVD